MSRRIPYQRGTPTPTPRPIPYRRPSLPPQQPLVQHLAVLAPPEEPDPGEVAEVLEALGGLQAVLALEIRAGAMLVEVGLACPTWQATEVERLMRGVAQGWQVGPSRLAER